MESYASQTEYLEALARRSELPRGFRAASVPLSFIPRERQVNDPLPMNLSLILMDDATTDFAGVFTRNSFPGAPVLIGRERLTQPAVRGVLINNKIANVCTPSGRENTQEVLDELGRLLGARGDDFFAASTGIIGWRLPTREMREALSPLVAALDSSSILPVARGIMTTDSFAKVRRATAGTGSVVGVAKGAGMIEPNMATLLCFICTDVKVTRDQLREDLSRCVQQTLNCVSVDGDQSTSDMALVFSSGKASAGRGEFRAALRQVLQGLASDIARNAEGGSHVIHVRATGFPDEETAVVSAKAIVNSPLVKTAMFGNDPNVGRLVSALGDCWGNRGIPVDARSLTLRLGGVEVFSSGAFLLDPAKEVKLSNYLKDCAFDAAVKGYPQHDRTVEVEVVLRAGAGEADVLGTDLSHEYVRENADYRS